jgi:hypothetical protein
MIKKFKESLRKKENLFFWTGLVMLVLATTLWFLNGGFVKTKTANAATDIPCTPDNNYCEKWSATKLLADVNSYDWNNQATYYVTEKRTCGGDGTTPLFDQQYPGQQMAWTFFALPGSPAAVTPCKKFSDGFHQEGMAASINTPIVVDWDLEGYAK